jgi:hypothetical protein
MDTEEHTHAVQLVAIREVADHFRTRVTLPITLNLGLWSAIRYGDAQPNDVSQLRPLLQHFVDFATQNGLGDTPAAAKVIAAISVLDDISPTTSVEDISQSTQVSFQEDSLSVNTLSSFQRVTATTEHGLDNARRQFEHQAQYDVPVFNIAFP